MKKSVGFLVMILILALMGYMVFKYYDYLFARTVSGKIEKVERVTQPVAVLGSQPLDPVHMYSFAVAMRDKDGEIVTGSTEDRQWAVVEPGKCAEVKFFPYPPWDLDKSGTYHKLRLIKLYDCPEAK